MCSFLSVRMQFRTFLHVRIIFSVHPLSLSKFYHRQTGVARVTRIVCGGRRMTADELIAFCVATETNPDYFRDVARDTA